LWGLPPHTPINLFCLQLQKRFNQKKAVPQAPGGYHKCNFPDVQVRYVVKYTWAEQNKLAYEKPVSLNENIHLIRADKK